MNNPAPSLWLTVTPILLLAGTAAAQTADPADPPPYPVEVSFQSADATYHQSKTGTTLYVSDADPVGQSLCNEERGCSSAWLPVLAPAGVRPVGKWSVVIRRDGAHQWALKGKPVYAPYHNLPMDELPANAGWHVLTRSYADGL